MPLQPIQPAAYDFPAICAEALIREKTSLMACGEPMLKSDVERVIREQDALRLDKPAKRSPGAKSATLGLYGDPKQIPPLPEWVTAYSQSIGYPMDGQAWWDSYDQKGWTVGKCKARMKNWQAAVRTWKSNKYGFGGIALGATKAARDYSRV